jgi:hypothetical protein
MEGMFSALSNAALVAEITTLAGHLNAANARFLALVAELDRRRGWAEWGVRSCAHWLNWKCGIDLGAAREKVRVARALATLPHVAAAMAEGRLSYAKVRAITRVAEASTEDSLLNIALCGTASHVEDVVRGYRRALDAQELSREAVQQREQRLWWSTEPDGSLSIRARLPAEVGALFVRAMGAAVDALPIPKDVSAETLPDELQRSRARRVEALAMMAETFLATGPKDLSGGDRNQIVVHVDAETLRDRTAGRCELEQGPAIASESARRLACDCSVVRIIENEKGEPLDVGRKTRTIPPAIRRALNSRDRGCRFPGCCFKRYVDGHHVKHWADGGETRLSNLVTLCRFHHRLVHEGQVVVHTLDDGAFRFLKPDGASFDSPPPGPAGWQELLETNDDIPITPQTALTAWRGEALDVGLAVDSLLHRRKNVPAAVRRCEAGSSLPQSCPAIRAARSHAPIRPVNPPRR